MQQICRRFLPLLLHRLASQPSHLSSPSQPHQSPLTDHLLALPDSWHICISNGEWRRVPGKLGGFGFTCSSPALTGKCAQLPRLYCPTAAVSPYHRPNVWQHGCELNLTFSFSGLCSSVAIKLQQLLMALPELLHSFHFRLSCGWNNIDTCWRRTSAVV